MSLRPWPARWPIGLRPTTERQDLKTGESFLFGDLVKQDGGGDIVAVTGTDPTPLYGFAAGNAEDAVEGGKVMVYKHDGSTHFAMSGDRDPVAGDVGTDYGIEQDSDNIWIVDTGDTSNTRVNVTDVDTDRGLYFVQVLSAHRQ